MLKRILCFVLYHQLYVVKRLGKGQRCIGCHRCGRYWAMSDEHRAFLEWDDEFTALYAFTPGSK